MPRTKEAPNTSNYHFVVWYKADPDSNEEPKRKYYKTSSDITSDFGICRSTIYNYYTKVFDADSRRKNRTVCGIDKLVTPVPAYKKIEVTFD
tara:strand:- start:260 stop:535 length:276 start_codon:yes stop_codon:yes gene_type:complete